MDELVNLLVELVKTATPVMWEAAYKQVNVKTIHEVLWIVGWIALFFGTRRASSYLEKESQKEEDKSHYGQVSWKTEQRIGSVALTACSFAVVLLALCNIGTIVGMLINPEYYAIKLLADLVR